MKTLHALWAVIPFFLVFYIDVNAQVPTSEHWKYMRTIEPEGYVCGRAAGAPAVDGRLDDPAWKAAPWTNYFADIEGPAKKPAPRFKTRVKMLWDDSYLYIGAEMEEPHVWGTLGYHDQVMFFENDFEMFIDPNGDNQEYYELEMSPLAAVWDMYLPYAYKDLPEGVTPDSTWDIPGIRVRVNVDGSFNDPRDTDRGWTLEMAIPWKGLQYKAHMSCPPLEGDTWRVNFSRVEYVCDVVTSDRTNPDVKNNAYKTRENVPCDNWVWSPQGVVNMHCPEMWGFVRFTSSPPGTVSFSPDPSLEVRRVLHDIYYAQRDFRGKNKRYAGNLRELGLDLSGNPAILGTPGMNGTPDGYMARVGARLSNGKIATFSIAQDAKIGME